MHIGLYVPGPSSLLATYRSETEQINAERIPQAVALFLVLIGSAGVFEHVFYPENFRLWVIFYLIEISVCLPLLALRRPLIRLRWLLRANIGTWVVLSCLMHSYGIAAGAPPELVAIGGLCLMTGASLLMPWGLRGQAVLATCTLVAFGITVSLSTSSSISPLYLLFGDCTGAIISVLGAHHLELHRFAIFWESTLREEEASISHNLVAIAKEINGALDADDVLNRISDVIRAALDCDWTLIILRDDERDVFLVIGSAGHIPSAVAGLDGVEFGPGVFPLVDQALREGTLEVPKPRRASRQTADAMRQWRTHSLLAKNLTRREQVVGILIAGKGMRNGLFSERARRLFRGIAQHAAIALNNVRLVTDLRHANNLKSEFLATMSHELRTPLNVIIGYADLLREEVFGPLRDEQQPIMGRLRDSAHSLLELISATLEVNRIEAGRTRAHLDEVDLRQLLADLQQETAQLPCEPDIALRWEVPSTQHLVRTDPTKFKIIVKNLVANALKFTQRGHVAVYVAYDPRSRQLDVRVQDTGAGIDPADLPRIFGMFQQIKGTPDNGGVGLGLYIVKRFVEQLDGHITVTSEVGEGSTFRVTLPAGATHHTTPMREPRQRRSHLVA